MMLDLGADIDRYLTYLERDRRVTPASLRNYRSTLTRFSDQYRVLNEKSVKAFLRQYPEATSANAVLTRLRGLAEYLDRPLTKVPRAKETVKEPEALNSRELARLREVAKSLDSYLGHFVTVLGGTGLRLHEFQALTKASVRSRDGVLYFHVHGKGRKDRKVPLTPEVAHSFDTIQQLEAIPEKRLRRMLAKAGRTAKLDSHVHPHLLRASFASILYNEKGVGEATIMKLLGWAKVDTFVKHYWRESIHGLKEAVA